MYSNFLKASRSLAVGVLVLAGASDAFAYTYTSSDLGVGCSGSNVTITSMTPSAGGANVVTSPINATNCLKIPFNDSGNLLPEINLGGLGYGLLNGEDASNGNNQPVIDIDPYLFTALDPVKNTIPGWIYLGKLEETWAAYKEPLDLSTLITYASSCTDCSSGTWTLTVDKDIVSKVSLYFGNGFFDHLAIILKAGNGNSDAGAVIYDFDFYNIIADGVNVAFNTPYNFSGTWSTADLGGKTISHTSVWAHDPPTQEVPEPGSLALAGLALMVLAGRRRGLFQRS